MSCQMTDNREIATLAEYVAAILNRAHYGSALEGVGRIRPPKSLTRVCAGLHRKNDDYIDPVLVYSALYNLNRSAYVGRYGSKAAFEVAPREVVNVKIKESDDTRRDWMPRLYNLLRFFVYQCEEEPANAQPLFRALCDLETRIACTIANEIVKAKNLNWGEF